MNYKFNLKILLEEEKNKKDLLVKYKYFRDNEDEITFNNYSININGQRSSEKAIIEFEEKENNKLYNELRLCIVTHYLMYGKKISDSKYFLTINDKEIKQDYLNNIFDLDLFSKDTKDTILTKNIVKNIFDKNYPKLIEVSAINYIKGLNNNDDNLNYYWKSFEAYAEYINKTDANTLNNVMNVINNKDTKELIEFEKDNNKFITLENIYTCKKYFINKINLFDKGKVTKRCFLRFDEVLSKMNKQNIIENIIICLKQDLLDDRNKIEKSNDSNKKEAIRKIDSFLSLKENFKENKDKYFKDYIVSKYPCTCFALIFAYNKRNEIFHGNNTEPIMKIKYKQQNSIYSLINEYLKILIKSLYSNEI